MSRLTTSNNTTENNIVSKAFTSSTVDQVQLSFTWTIENITKLLNQKKSSKVIRSPNFFSDYDEDTQWYLEFYPRGKDDHKDYVCLILTLDCTNQSEVLATYKLAVVAANGQPSMQHCFREEARFSEGDARGKDNLIGRSQILEKNKNFLVNDSLTFECEIAATRVVHVTRNPTANKNPLESTQANLAQELSVFAGDVRFSDIIFYVRGREFPAHKVVLAARSPIFLAMFEERSEGKNEPTKTPHPPRFEMKDIEPDVFQQALKYIYAGQVDNLEVMAAPLLAIADKYALGHLKAICEDSLIKSLNSANVGSIYMLADVHSAENLKAEALKLMQQTGGLLIGPKH